jgi:hypothetical protein
LLISGKPVLRRVLSERRLRRTVSVVVFWGTPCGGLKTHIQSVDISRKDIFMYIVQTRVIRMCSLIIYR